MPDPNEFPQVAVLVGILTFRRPLQLGEMLPLVSEQLSELNRITGRDGVVVVVDNDHDASARPVVLDLASEFPVVRYVHEPTPGIAAARQRCLDEADGMDLLQFIDDDEIPAPRWLHTMVATWAAYDRPAAVAGSVLPRYQSPPPEFVRAGGFFERRQFETGTVLPVAWSGNLLVDLHQLRGFGVGFDTRLGLRGGEDSIFTRQITAAGGRIIFCREAPIFDLVPDDRNNRQWVLQRAWHHGSTISLARLWDLPPGPRRVAEQATLLFGGMARAVVGYAQAAVSRLRGSVEGYAKGLRLARRGLGRAAGAIWSQPPEYDRG